MGPKEGDTAKRTPGNLVAEEGQRKVASNRKCVKEEGRKDRGREF